MALTSWPTQKVQLISPWGTGNPNAISTGNGATIDLAGEKSGMVGLMSWSDAGSHTISSAGGGEMWFRPGGTLTWATANSQIQIGIQDVGVTGLEDGTYDVLGTLTQGTDTLTASTTKKVAMTSGTKTIADGDKIWVGVEFITRNGADSVQISTDGSLSGYGFPYATINGAISGGSGLPCITIEADDGTIGTIEMASPAFDSFASMATFQVDSTPDEYALLWQLPFECRIRGFGVYLASVATTDDFEVLLYTTPLGTPAASKTVVYDADLIASAAQGWHFGRFAATYPTIAANTDFAIAVRPTTTNTIQFFGMNFGSANATGRGGLLFGTNARLGTRTNVTGAFSESTHIVPAVCLLVDQLHDGAGAGGGLRMAGMGGLAA